MSESDFQCFGGKRKYVGTCVHREAPVDGHYKVADKHVKMLEDCCAKYEGLVSYARDADQLTHPARKRFPKECDKLHGKGARWQHGYNSGMLASTRLVLSLCMKELDSIREIENDDADDEEESSATSEDDFGDTAPPEFKRAKFAFEHYPDLNT